MLVLVLLFLFSPPLSIQLSSSSPPLSVIFLHLFLSLNFRLFNTIWCVPMSFCYFMNSAQNERVCSGALVLFWLLPLINRLANNIHVYRPIVKYLYRLNSVMLVMLLFETFFVWTGLEPVIYLLCVCCCFFFLFVSLHRVTFFFIIPFQFMFICLFCVCVFHLFLHFIVRVSVYRYADFTREKCIAPHKYKHSMVMNHVGWCNKREREKKRQKQK